MTEAQLEQPQQTNKRRRESSFAAAVADLAVGEQTAKLQRIDTTLPVDTIRANLSTMREAMRNNTMPAVTRARAKTGATYTIEVTDFMTTALNWFLIAVVTRAE
jgi:hypothetical protein